MQEWSRFIRSSKLKHMMTDKDRKNCTTIFLLPSIGHTRQKLLPYGFLSAYLDDINHSVHYENAVYILFKPEKMDEFHKFLSKEYLKSPLIIQDYDYKGGYIVVIYSINDRFLPDYQLFLEGKYSQFSKEYMKLFPSKIAVDKKNGTKEVVYSLQHRLFNRTKDMKALWEQRIGQAIPENMELWSVPDMSKEVLDISLYE